MSEPRFPRDFVWGAATSAYQIEGSPLADGAGESIWHRFSHTPGRVVNGETGDVACDHYRRMDADVALMAELGLRAYRFSVAWGRVMPEGAGPVNRAGLGFYDRLVDRLLEHGIEPFLTLYHWDLPAALDDRGGWLNRNIAGWFADYAGVMFRALDDRVGHWITLNEPWVVVDAGYVNGVHAPGHADPREAPVAAHNLLRAHGEAVARYRETGRHRIGIAVNLEPKYPASDSLADREAASRSHAYMNRQFLDPLFRGRYPKALERIYGDAWCEPGSDEMALICGPIDFLGVNYYTRSVVREGTEPPFLAAVVPQTGAPHTEMDWEVYPQGLSDTLTWLSDHYDAPPIYVTENGAACPDPADAEGRVEDTDRIAYFREHLKSVLDARSRGVDVRGYFAWSLFDNFEWSFGYDKRFGLVRVDFSDPVRPRTPKASAGFYTRVIDSRGGNLFG
ncbi:MAG: GH1 family beta-glucosidase [Pseudomonadota bacterium]|nr:GH1 family beta-glucosidase [Pseudomonadota bacterium]